MVRTSYAARRSRSSTPPEGAPGAAGTILLLQKWKHDAREWGALAVDRQERTTGRTKLDSIELDDKPSDPYVARADQEEFGEIFPGRAQSRLPVLSWLELRNTS